MLNLRPFIPEGLFVKCSSCNETIYKNDLEENQKVCLYCAHHFKMTPWERMESLLDKESFQAFDEGMTSGNPLAFKGYEEKLKKAETKSGLREAVITGRGSINEMDVVIGVMDSNFMMASMGSVVGEKITRAIEYATHYRLPIVFFIASGGARMQEGIYSLMQMAKTSGALALHHKKGLLYVPVLTHPTTGGVTASFAMLGDIILAEPEALIGFAGPRVIEQTIGQTLPQGFQKAEFLLEHGFIDKIVPRKSMKKTLGLILKMHMEEMKC